LVSSAARLAKNSDPLPLGVSAATTWLNLMTIGACAQTRGAATARAVAARRGTTGESHAISERQVRLNLPRAENV
jgi:hypothetical protein